jgi:hypothetical protein
MFKNRLYSLLISSCLAILPLIVLSQEVRQDWIKTDYTGRSESLTTDPDGNVYLISGHFIRSLDDFDIMINKIKPSGEEEWTKTYNGLGNGSDSPTEILLLNNYIYVTGRSEGEGTQQDIVLLKYSLSGDLIWVRRFNGRIGLNDVPVKMNADLRSNEIVITGFSHIDRFNSEIVTLKYNESGDRLWVRTLNRFEYIDSPSDMMIDSFGNILITGATERESNPIRPANSDFATLKYDPSGTLLWDRYYNFGLSTSAIATNDHASDIDMDEIGNIYVVGERQDYFTMIKYFPDGAIEWNFDIEWRSNMLPKLAVFDSNNIYISNDNQDAQSVDFYKYNSARDQLWRISYRDPRGSRILLNSIRIDGTGNITTGINGQFFFKLLHIDPTGIINWVADSRILTSGSVQELTSIDISQRDVIYISGFNERSISSSYTLAGKFSLHKESSLILPILTEYEYFDFSSYVKEKGWCWSELNLDWKIIPICPIPIDCPEPSFSASLIHDQKTIWEDIQNVPFKTSLPFNDQLNSLSIKRETKDGYTELIHIDQGLVKNGFTALHISANPKENLLHVEAETDGGISVPFMITLNNKEGKGIWNGRYNAPMSKDLVEKVKEPGTTLLFSIPYDQPQFKSYPNPFSGDLNIDVNARDDFHAEAVILDLKGKRLIKETFKKAGNYRMKMQDLKPGLYILIFSQGGKEVKKLIEKKY